MLPALTTNLLVFETDRLDFVPSNALGLRAAVLDCHAGVTDSIGKLSALPITDAITTASVPPPKSQGAMGIGTSCIQVP